MNKSSIEAIVHSVLIQHFNIQQGDFDWEQPLEKLDSNFKNLNTLVFFEQLLDKELNKNVLLLENISATIHTPNDIIKQIMKVI